MAVVATWHGATARLLRQALRLSCDDFAALLGVSSRGVAKWEAAPVQKLALHSQQILDIALKRADDDAVTRFIQLMEYSDLARRPPKAVDVGPYGAGMRVTGPVTSELVDSLARALTGYYATDNLLGPRALLPVVISTAEAVEELWRGASGPLLDGLLRVGAGYAEFAGWLCQDGGDDVQAAAWYRRSLEWAEAADDPRMSSFVLMRRAAQHLSSRDGQAAIRLAAAAQRDRSLMTARVRAIAAQTEALGHAICGGDSEADRALDAAAVLVEQAGVVSVDDDPSYGRYCQMPLYLAISQAKCDLELKRADKAIASLTAVLDLLPANYHRDRGQYLARLAQAYALARQPEQACERAGESLAIAGATGSTRTVAELRRLPELLKPWSATEPVTRLHDILARTV